MKAHLLIFAVVAGALAQTPEGRQPVSAEERAKIEAALPVKAPAAPRKHRRLLIVDYANGRAGHPSIPHADLAVELMGTKTGAYETVISHDASLLDPASLRGFDAVYLNNAQGAIFNTRQRREGFEDYIRSGGGLVANHAATTVSPDWPEFGDILGARGASHRMADEKATLRVEQPTNPVVSMFPPEFENEDEFFRVQAPYSRDKVTVLLSIDAARTDMNQGRCFGNCFRGDHDYPISWLRTYGKGRVFYTSLGHNPHAFWDANVLAHFLAAIQFALGDLDAAPAPPAVTLTSIEQLFPQIARYRYGDNRQPMLDVESFIGDHSRDPQTLAQVEERLVGLLTGDSTPGGKDFAVKQLRLIGTAKSVPVLARMLRSAEAADLARYALEAMPDPAADRALRDASAQSTGKVKAGIDNSLLARHPRPEAPAPGLASGLASSDVSQQIRAIRASAASNPSLVVERYPTLPPVVQIQALGALASAGTRAALPLAMAAVQNGSGDFRIAGLRALGDIGDTGAVPLLASAAANGEAAERQAARDSLQRLRGADVDQAIVNSILNAEPKLKLELIRAARERGTAAATPALIEISLGADAPARGEAFRALRQTAGLGDVPALLALVQKAAPADRQEAGAALASALRRFEKADTAPVIGAYQSSGDPGIRRTLLEALGQTGSAKVLPYLREALKGSDPELTRVAILSLSDWPAAAPLDDLLTLAKTTHNPAQQVLALRGFIKLIALPSGRTADQTTDLLASALSLAKQPDEKKMALAALPRYACPAALRLAQSLTTDPAVGAEAGAAAKRIAQTLDQVR